MNEAVADYMIGAVCS